MTADKRADILSLARKTIHTEALALKHLEQTLGDDFVCAVELILHSRGKLVVTGMGKSGLIGRKIAATLASTGTPSFFLHPGEAFHGDLGMISKEDIVLALEEYDLSDKQCKALLKSPSPLADVFKDFEKRETDHMDIIRDTIECRANAVIRADFLRDRREAR